MLRGKVDAQRAYVLHTRPYRETSLLLEVFSRDYGRVALLARGARRPRSALRGLLMGFQPLELHWSGKGEVLTLMKAEWQGGQPILSGLPLFCGYYLNELLVKLLPREDPHPVLFEHYAKILLHLGYVPQGWELEANLRSFERALLQELGYGLTLDREQGGSMVVPEAFYRYQIEWGPVRVEASEVGAISGQTLLDMASDDYHRPMTRQEAKQLMRRLLGYYLNDTELESRKLVKEMQEF